MLPVSRKNVISLFSYVVIFIVSLAHLQCINETEEIRTKNNTDGLKKNASTFIYNMIPRDAQAQISLEYGSAINSFSVNLLNKIYNNDLYRGMNVVVSPYCISRNLATITEASAGETQQELINVLGGRVVLDDANSALKKLLYADASVLLLVADGIWIDSNNYTILPSYKDTANKKYGVEIKGLNFNDLHSSINVINKWISGNTYNRITNAVKESYFKEYTAILITSTIYFEADWTSPFDVTKTESLPFFTPTGSLQIDMMTSSYLHKTRKTNEYDNVKIYYGTDKKDFFYLDIYMPTSITIDEFIGQKCLSALSVTDSFEYGNLKLPKFFFENEIDLKPVLKNLGINSAFNELKGEISGMAIDKETQKNASLYIEMIKHTAGIKMDEEGTAAYAVTVTSLADNALDKGSPDIVIDHPFVYFVRAGTNGLVLFAGVVNNPNCKPTKIN